MTEPNDPAGQPSTPEATKAEAQSRRGAADAGEAPPVDELAGLGTDFLAGRGVRRPAVRPHERAADEPLYRQLQIYTLDPGESVRDGAVATVRVPFEPLAPGPVGRFLAVGNRDGATDARYRRADLDDHRLLLEDGLRPTPSDPRFHAQMVYTVCTSVYYAFRRAIGRDPAWGFEPHAAAPADGAAPESERLRLEPFAMEERNAYYDKRVGALRFGYFRGEADVAGHNLPRGFVFTALSHDVVAHEMAHALLDGLRAHFSLPTNPDVLAFHEAFADLVAVFQPFSYPGVVRAALRRTHGDVRAASLLVEIGRQFGHTTGGDERAGALRTAFDVNELQAQREGAARGEAPAVRVYDQSLPPHQLGSVLVAAVFDAFATVFERKTERYRLLATGGSGILPPGEMSPVLQEMLANQASQLASQFLSICIRAVDYCPPVDLRFGEYLRALITADRDLVPDDPWHYR